MRIVKSEVDRREGFNFRLPKWLKVAAQKYAAEQVPKITFTELLERGLKKEMGLPNE